MAVVLGTLVGALFGGVLFSALFGSIIERFFFKDQEPDKRATSTVGLAWVLEALLAGWGFSDGNGFAWLAGLYYLPGAAIVWLLFRRRYRDSWVDDVEPEFESEA